MKLYSPERPEIAPDVPALLGHSCAVPWPALLPSADGERITVSVLLPKAYHTFGTYSLDLTPSMILEFFRDYYNNPEKTLAAYFEWDMTPTAPTAPTAAKLTPTITPDEQLDLL